MIMKSILITGGNGNLAKMIKRHFNNITSISRADFDLLDCNAFEHYLSDKTFDVLIHTAISGGRRGKEETADVVYKNLLMFENIMLFAHKFQLIINFDSITEIYTVQFEDETTEDKFCNQLKIYFPCDCNIV